MFFRRVDCLALPVADLDEAIDFYGELGHEVLWRTATRAGLRLAESDAELVLQTERPDPETDLSVEDVLAAVGRGHRLCARLSSVGDERATSGRFLRRVRLAERAPRDAYPFAIPAVRELASVPFGAVTCLVGDNGTGKSTIVEALAVAVGFNAEGGGRNLRFATHATHSDLHEHLELVWNERPRWGWFLRAETFYGLASHVVQDNDPWWGVDALFPDLHGGSHGESFIDIALARFRAAGFYLLDEPESALSLVGQLRLLRIVHDSCSAGSQFVVATHSPLLMAFPGATIIELDEYGAHQRDYDDVEVVGLWRRFLADPGSFLGPLLAD
jgi:predicted ATPase